MAKIVTRGFDPKHTAKSILWRCFCCDAGWYVDLRDTMDFETSGGSFRASMKCPKCGDNTKVSITGMKVYRYGFNTYETFEEAKQTHGDV